MSDILSELESIRRKTYLEFCKTQEDAKLPKFCDNDPSLFILFAAKDYIIYAGTLPDGEYNDDADIEIATGVKIKSAQNVELTAFAPVENNGFERSIFEKQSEIVISPKHQDELVFKASQLFRVDFSLLRPTVLHIHKGDPICYLKASPTFEIWVAGVES